VDRQTDRQTDTLITVFRYGEKEEGERKGK